jgi:hypothetical protein
MSLGGVRGGSIRLIGARFELLLRQLYRNRSGRKSLSRFWQYFKTLRPMPFTSEPVLVPGILMSDSAIVEVGTGKRSIIGSFDQFTFSQFPAIYPRLFLTAWVSNMAGTFSTLELTFRVEDKASGHVALSFTTAVTFPTETTFAKDLIMAVSAPVAGLTFPKAGLYTIVLLLAGEKVGERDFNVLQAAAPKPQQ